MPRCPLCGSWNLTSDCEYESVFSGAQVKRYTCTECGAPVETVNNITTPMEAHTLEWRE